MNSSYAVLAASLVGVVGLARVAQLVASDNGAEAVVMASRVAEDRAGRVHDDEVSSDDPIDAARARPGLDRIGVIDQGCTLSTRLGLGDIDAEVACLESQLIAAGTLDGVVPDDVFDAATEAAVRTFQEASGVTVDGVVGGQTAALLGSWVGAAQRPPDPATCPATGRSAVIDRFNQRSWLCEDGEITEIVPITSAISQPDPGTYEVYAKDMNASSTVTGDYSTMTHFVAFTHGKYQGARIAFHSIPQHANGDYVQPLDSVGSPELFGDSSGCIRLLPDDAALIWGWLDIGDAVRVVS